jgi:hypothetical protein
VHATSIGERRAKLEQDTLLALWQDGVPLSVACLVFADEQIATRFFQLRRTGSHLELQRVLQSDLIGRLREGKRQALGIQEGSDPGLILIPQYYFSKTAQFDWENDIIVAIGKVFHEVRVKWEREQPGQGRALKPTQWIHPRELEAVRELGPPTDPGPFVDPCEQCEQDPLEEMLPSEQGPPNNLWVQREPQSLNDALPSEAAPEKHEESYAPSKVRGRPSKVPEIERAIEILFERGIDLANMSRQKAYKAVRQCAANELNSNIKLGFTDPVIHRSLFKRFGPLR